MEEPNLKVFKLWKEENKGMGTGVICMCMCVCVVVYKSSGTFLPKEGLIPFWHFVVRNVTLLLIISCF